MNKIETTDITVLSHNQSEISLSDLISAVGTNRDIHVFIDCEDFLPADRPSDVGQNYIKLIQKVIRTYSSYDPTQITNPVQANRIINDINKGLLASLNSSINAYNNKQGHRYIEMQFKQMQSGDETYSITRHFKVNFRTCAKKTTTILN